MAERGSVNQGARRVMTSIDEFVDHIDTAHVGAMVLRSGTIRAEVVSANVCGVVINLVDHTCPTVTRGETLTDRVGILTPFGRLPVACVNGDRFQLGTGHAFGGSAEMSGWTTGTTEYATLSFTPDSLERMAGRLGIEIDLPGQGERRTVPAPSHDRLGGLLRAVKRSVYGTGKPAASIREAAELADRLVAMFVESFAADRSRARSTPHKRLDSVHIVKQCEDYATDTNYQAVTLADLCEASGVSERRARQAFYECYGMSPTAFLRIAALYKVHHALVAGPPERDAVSRAAADYGFWHLSRFASQYRALFGELPSTTLRGRPSVAVG
jgi:AraC-like DNA-binding protein